ncbi:hypothetical protein D3Y59_13565 [Hymenobacter oligotrophus]|uniref:SbsA Ig-like domain-containing protein n=1 Tax=Hymenobacter oligotrophus TaxID=2319843 RepID=A0A3B7QXU0_9BACT|nr:Ig-like domain-containing domain [Hymenobacter oligotrophus]AYA37978.1 hypothetical protein D3Y59_13565 [Hymenobacter oligotrophus]
MFVRPYLLLLLPVGFWVAGCAAISQPEGGARDTVAPKFVSSSPKNGATNVSQQSIRLEFSEPVQLKDLSKNLIITPSLAEGNEYKVREERNAIELRFEKPLDENTTYVFNFGEAVTDITENNKAANVVLAFSTGAALDSGSVSGTVVQLLTGQPEADAVVALYPARDTADIRRARPYYLGRTDKSGAFRLNNLRADNYRLYALVDKNQNTRYEEPERIAYLPQPVQVQPRADSLRLFTVRPDARRPLIQSQQPSAAQFRIGYNEGLRQLTLAALGQPPKPEQNQLVALAEKGRTAVVYRAAAMPAGRYLVSATDSAGNVGLDTVNVRFAGETLPPRKGPQYQLANNQRETPATGQLRLQFNEPLRLVTNKPFATLVEDSTTRRPLRAPADGQLSPDRTQLIINLNTRARRAISIVPDSTAITGVTGQSLGLRPVRLRITEQATTGSLSGTVQTAAKRFELQLLDDKYQLVASLQNPRTFRFDNLAPGSYRLRVLVDANNDGRWQGGDPGLRRPAEPVWIYQQPLTVRANWEVEDIRFGF